MTSSYLDPVVQARNAIALEWAEQKARLAKLDAILAGLDALIDRHLIAVPPGVPPASTGEHGSTAPGGKAPTLTDRLPVAPPEAKAPRADPPPDGRGPGTQRGAQMPVVPGTQTDPAGSVNPRTDQPPRRMGGHPRHPETGHRSAGACRTAAEPDPAVHPCRPGPAQAGAGPPVRLLLRAGVPHRRLLEQPPLRDTGERPQTASTRRAAAGRHGPHRDRKADLRHRTGAGSRVRQHRRRHQLRKGQQMTTATPPGMRCDQCTGTTPCFCQPHTRNRQAANPAPEESCDGCDTPIGWFGDGAGWRHLQPHSTHPDCRTAVFDPDPLVLGDVPPLDGLLGGDHAA